MLLVSSEDIERYQRPRAFAPLLFGTCLGLAFLTRAMLAPAVAVLAFSYAWMLVSGWKRTRRKGIPIRELLLGFGPALALLGVFLWINYTRFGDPLETGYGTAGQYFT